MSKPIIQCNGKRYLLVAYDTPKAGQYFLSRDTCGVDRTTVNWSPDGYSRRHILAELPPADPQPEPKIIWERTGEYREVCEGEWFEGEDGCPRQMRRGWFKSHSRWILRRIEVPR